MADKNTLDLFPELVDDPRKLARRADPATSHEAAVAVAPKLPHLRDLVWRIIASFGGEGCISDQVAMVMLREGVRPYSSTTARFKELAQAGRIRFTGETRKGLSGRSQRVMVALKEDDNAAS